jgi:hypothetical protein
MARRSGAMGEGARGDGERLYEEVESGAEEEDYRLLVEIGTEDGKLRGKKTKKTLTRYPCLSISQRQAPLSPITQIPSSHPTGTHPASPLC